MMEKEMEIEELIRMIDGKMQAGTSRLSVSFSEDQAAGTKKESYHHGRCDVGSPWAKGTVNNCDYVDETFAGSELSDDKEGN